jgi:hypothetical protein
MVEQWAELAILYERMVMEAYGVGQYPVAECLAAVSRSDEARDALSEATTILEAARQGLVALEQQLGYIPGVSKVAANSRAIPHSPNSG